MTKLSFCFLLFAFLLLVTIATERSFVDGAPTTSATSSPSEILKSTQRGAPEVVPETLDANVRELESLKQTIGKTLEMMKSQSVAYSNVHGNTETHSDVKSEVKQDGKLVLGIGEHIDKEQPGGGAPASGSLRIDVDIPEKNIHKSSVQRLLPSIQQQIQPNEAKRDFLGDRNEEDVASALLPGAFTFASSRDPGTNKLIHGDNQYTPLDMAEYVFWTGDEKGVTLAIEEFLQAGLLTRKEAIVFLQEIKYNLDYLQQHYSKQLGLNDVRNNPANNENTAEELMKYRETMQQIQELQQMGNEKPDPVQPTLNNNFDITKLRFQPMKKKFSDFEEPKENTNELMNRLKVADFLYTEYSLEEIIYQLAKVMFAQSLTHGSTEGHEALQKFTTFLENEAEQGHISKSLEKKVLDVLIASLTDTLNEHTDMETIREYLQDNKQDKSLHLSRVVDDNTAAIENNRDPYDVLTKYKSILD